MNTKYIYLSGLLVIVAVLSIGVFQLTNGFSGGFSIQNVENLNVAGDTLNGSPVTPETDEFGAVVNIDRHRFPQGITFSAVGGGLLTVASGSKTFSASDICDNILVNHTGATSAIASAQTNKLPTGSSLIAKCLPQKGDSRTIRYENNATAGSGRFIFTFTTNTGLDLFVASGSGVVGGKGDGPRFIPEGTARVTFTNINGSSVSVDFLEMLNAD